jgi:hypothetical protein
MALRGKAGHAGILAAACTGATVSVARCRYLFGAARALEGFAVRPSLFSPNWEGTALDVSSVATTSKELTAGFETLRSPNVTIHQRESQF